MRAALPLPRTVKTDGQTGRCDEASSRFSRVLYEGVETVCKISAAEIKTQGKRNGFTFPDTIYVAYRMLYWVSEMNFNSETCLTAGEQIIK